MTTYKLELLLHVLAVIVALGATFAFPFLQGQAERRGTGATRFYLEFSHFLEKFVVIPGAILTFIFGGMLIGNDKLPYKDDMPAWLTISVIWFIAAFAVAIFMQRKNTLAGIKALEGVPDTSPLPESYAPIGRRTQIIGGLLGVSIMGIAFLMIWKPGQ
ncbi:MAG: DUF2269 domain-containing protein [Dehalococcoidia bacterium]|nr:DUF2269 domain-containing protein [Dehalococcoidia bacterium]